VLICVQESGPRVGAALDDKVRAYQRQGNLREQGECGQAAELAAGLVSGLGALGFAPHIEFSVDPSTSTARSLFRSRPSLSLHESLEGLHCAMPSLHK
jgi:hypothetical protein